MKTRQSTGEAIAALINTRGGEALSARERYIFREALHALVRLAKSELMMEMKTNVKKLTAPAHAQARAQRSKPPRQQQFEFNQNP
jgi:hypothetical protein